MSVHRGGQIRAEDYYELWHEHCALEEEGRVKILRLERDVDKWRYLAEQLQWLIGLLEVPTLEQLEVRALRAQLDAPPQTDEESTVEF